MKVLLKLFGGICVLISSGLQAQADYVGTWEGTLITGPGAEMTVRFVIDAGDSGDLSVLITSPDSGALKDVPASDVTVNGNEINLVFDSLNGGFSGALENGRIAGQWQQLNQSFALVMTPYVRPAMSAEDIAFLQGSWLGNLQIPGIELPVVFRFEPDEEGDMVGQFDSPQEGAFGLPVNNLQYAGSQLSLNLDFANVRIEFQRDGSGFSGTWYQSGQEFPVTLTRGEYEQEVYPLSIETPGQEQLRGTWVGKLGPEGQQQDIEIRFENNEAGDFVAFFEVKSQGAVLSFSEGTLAGNTLTLKLKLPPVEYTAEVNGDEIIGTWKIIPAAINFPLTITRM